MIKAEKSHLPVVAMTHAGMSGKENEDQFGVAAFTLSEKDATPVLLAVLSDGIGGHRAGEVASEMAVQIIMDHIARSDASHPKEIMKAAVEKASDAIQKQSRQNEEQHGMGGTCSLAWIIGDRLHATTIGDSRLYLIRRKHLQQVSHDHTWIQEALDKGIITPEEVKGHPNAHVIRRYLGSQKPPDPDFRLRLKPHESDAQSEAHQGMRLQHGDILLLCSDGLTDVVPDVEIEDHFARLPIAAAIPKLIDLANKNGGPDNITAVAIQVQAQSNPRRIFTDVLLATLVGVALCAAALVLEARYFFQGSNLAMSVQASTERAAVTEILTTEPVVNLSSGQPSNTPMPRPPGARYAP